VKFADAFSSLISAGGGHISPQANAAAPAGLISGPTRFSALNGHKLQPARFSYGLGAEGWSKKKKRDPSVQAVYPEFAPDSRFRRCSRRARFQPTCLWASTSTPVAVPRAARRPAPSTAWGGGSQQVGRGRREGKPNRRPVTVRYEIPGFRRSKPTRPLVARARSSAAEISTPVGPVLDGDQDTCCYSYFGSRSRRLGVRQVL